MLVEFVVGSCDCFERVFSKDCSFYFLNIVISIFKFSQSREDKLPQWLLDKAIIFPIHSFVHLFARSSSSFFVHSFINLFIHLAKQHPLLLWTHCYRWELKLWQTCFSGTHSCLNTFESRESPTLPYCIKFKENWTEFVVLKQWRTTDTCSTRNMPHWRFLRAFVQNFSTLYIPWLFP